MNTASDKKRIISLDLLRGISILVMVLSHSISVFHDGSNSVLEGLKTVSNTVAFTSFLFISGAVSYISYIKSDENWPQKKKKLLRRTLSLLLIYYILALIGNLKEPDIIKTFLFTNLAGYTEFILVFIFFSVAILLFRPAIKLLTGNFAIALPAGITFFAAGSILAGIDFGALSPLKYLLAGSEGIYSFPLLQYSLIFIIGLLWGRFTDEKQQLKDQKKLILKIFVFLLPIVIGLFFFYQYLEMDVFKRWPPRIGFLSLGIMFVFSILFILSSKKIESSHSIVKKVLLFLSAHALSIFLYHTFIILIYDHYFGIRTENGIMIIAIFGLIVLVSSAFSKTEGLVKRWGKTFIQNIVSTSRM